MDQSPPRVDSRSRNHRSAKCDVAELIIGASGATSCWTHSAERVLYLFPSGRGDGSLPTSVMGFD